VFPIFVKGVEKSQIGEDRGKNKVPQAYAGAGNKFQHSELEKGGKQVPGGGGGRHVFRKRIQIKRGGEGRLARGLIVQKIKKRERIKSTFNIATKRVSTARLCGGDVTSYFGIEQSKPVLKKTETCNSGKQWGRGHFLLWKGTKTKTIKAHGPALNSTGNLGALGGS